MISTKRKKLLLEKHNRLIPIDEALLKSKNKLQDTENESGQQTEASSTVLPSTVSG
jgi:hypothetical protein